MHKPLDRQSLDDALKACATKVRKDGTISDADVDAIAADFEIRPDVLRQRFDINYPDGNVGASLPKWDENKRRRIEVALESIRENLLPFLMDGRRIKIGEKEHTIIHENKSTKTVYTFSHEDEKEKQYSYSKIQKIGFEFIEES